MRMRANNRSAGAGQPWERVAASVRTPYGSAAVNEKNVFATSQSSIQRSAGKPFTVVTAVSMGGSSQACSPPECTAVRFVQCLSGRQPTFGGIRPLHAGSEEAADAARDSADAAHNAADSAQEAVDSAQDASDQMENAPDEAKDAADDALN